MKISPMPVQGMPTITQNTQGGLSQEKMERIKGIAAGKSETPHEKTVEVAQKEAPSNTVIKMKTNATPETLPTQEAAPATETVPEKGISDTDVQTKPAPEAIQSVSPQIAALAKEKRSLQIRAKELEEKEKAILAESQSRATLEQRIKSGHALSVLQELGVTYDQLTEQILGKASAPDLTKAKEDILKAVDERLADKDTQQEKAVFDHMTKNVSRLSQGTEYPFIREEGAQDKVMELIRRSWKEEGEVVDEEEACSLIENELKEKAHRIAKLLKEPEQTTPAAVEIQPNQKPVPQGIKTLTNKDSARAGLSRRQRAIAAMLGQK